jgi:hypothetical protein
VSRQGAKVAKVKAIPENDSLKVFAVFKLRFVFALLATLREERREKCLLQITIRGLRRRESSK